jgi:hypothetical protein
MSGEQLYGAAVEYCQVGCSNALFVFFFSRFSGTRLYPDSYANIETNTLSFRNS